jgi:hypothetical protein
MALYEIAVLRSKPGVRKGGGPGIQVCEHWRASLPAFLTDSGPRPSMNHRPGRIDEAGDFRPDNCHRVHGPPTVMGIVSNYHMGDMRGGH